jgi:imidazolonepropionase-like amidohydrolase
VGSLPALVIVAERLIDGTGSDPVERAAVIIEDGRITAAAARSSLTIPVDADVLEDDDLTLLPGFMDMHVHLAMSGTNLVRFLMTPPSLALLESVPNCGRTLAAGVTTVRDAGNTPIGVRLASEAGHFPAPRMELAIGLLSQTGGHGDDWMPCGVHFGASNIDVPHPVVDGVDGMRRKVREVLRAGADWIKLCTSGGVLSAGDLPDHAQFSVDEIRVAVEEAAVVGKRVMAHAMSPAGIRNALIAGVTSIEHGCLLDEQCIALMKEKGAYLVPTLVAPGDVIAGATGPGGGGLPAEMIEKAQRIGALHRAAVSAAIAAGVKVAMGTDAAVGPHGRNLREVGEMVRCGMSAMQAIVASTTVPAELLRRPDLGSLEAGKLGDVVAMRGDPLADIDSLADPARIRLVIKDGRVAYDFRATSVAAQPSSGSSSSAAS